MPNFDTVEIITWVQKTVGGSINRMMALPNSGVVELDQSDKFREKIYLHCTKFLVSDAPLEMDIKKECVVQCLMRLENAAALRAKDTEIHILSGRTTYWSGKRMVDKLLASLSDENLFEKMLTKEAQQIATSVSYINNLQNLEALGKIGKHKI